MTMQPHKNPTGLNQYHRRVLAEEKLTVVLVCKGFFVAECDICTDKMIFATKETDRSWSCDRCDRCKYGDRVSNQYARTITYPKKPPAKRSHENDLSLHHPRGRFPVHPNPVR